MLLFVLATLIRMPKLCDKLRREEVTGGWRESGRKSFVPENSKLWDAVWGQFGNLCAPPNRASGDLAAIWRLSGSDLAHITSPHSHPSRVPQARPHTPASAHHCDSLLDVAFVPAFVLVLCSGWRTSTLLDKLTSEEKGVGKRKACNLCTQPAAPCTQAAAPCTQPAAPCTQVAAHVPRLQPHAPRLWSISSGR